MMQRDHGTTLIELIVALAFGGLFAVMLHQFSHAMIYGVGVLAAVSEAEEAVRVALHVITRDLRDAGLSRDGRLGNGIRNARSDGVDAVADRNGDGDIDDANERIGYETDTASQTLRRSLGLSPPQPFLSHIAPRGVLFRYFDGDGSAVTIDPADRDACARIRRIEVTLQTDIAHPNPASRVPIRTVQSAAVALRNE